MTGPSVKDGIPKLICFVIWFILFIVASNFIKVLFLFPTKQTTVLPYVERTALPAV